MERIEDYLTHDNSRAPWLTTYEEHWWDMLEMEDHDLFTQAQLWLDWEAEQDAPPEEAEVWADEPTLSEINF